MPPSSSSFSSVRLDRRRFLAGTAVAAGAFLPTVAAARPSPRPSPTARSGNVRNIIWIVADDLGPSLGCYGYPEVRTPHLDRLAAQGRRYTGCFTTAPVCSPSRSAMFTGRYQTAIHAHQHRTWQPRPLPAGTPTLADQFRQAGYFTCNLAPEPDPADPLQRSRATGSGKTDFNFHIDQPYDGRDWKQRAPGQPFFAHVNLLAPHRGGPWELAQDRPAAFNRDNLRLPAWCPDHPVMWEDTFNYLKAIELLDEQIGEVLARLEREGLLENSVVVFMGDNGEPLYRSKQFLYDGGLHVPLLIRWPDQSHAGEVDYQLVSGVDLPSMLLGLAGLPSDPGMHGYNLLDPACPPRDHVIAARDRMGLGSDRIRAVRTSRYKYIRNYLPGIPYMQLNPYKEESYPPWNLLRELARAGELSPAQAAFAADRKPFEELYDLAQDPDEVNNIAQDPAHLPALRDLRGKLDHWLATYPDHGAVMEEPLDVLRVNAATARRIGLTPLI